MSSGRRPPCPLCGAPIGTDGKPSRPPATVPISSSSSAQRVALLTWLVALLVFVVWVVAFAPRLL